MKSIDEAGVDYAATGAVSPNGKVMVNFQVEMAFEAGANYVLDEIENFMKDLDLGNSAEEKFYKLDVLADIELFIEQLKK